MRESVFSPLNIFLIFALVSLSTWKHSGDFIAGIGYAIGMFFLAGALVGVVLLGIYGFIRNLTNPNSGYKPKFKDRISATLAGAILALLII